MKKLFILLTVVVYSIAAQSQNTPGPIINIDTATGVTTVNWPQFRDILVSFPNLKAVTGKDSLDYFGEVFYATPYKIAGARRTAIKHKRKEQAWYYESYFEIIGDTMKVKRDIIGLYQALKQSIEANTGTDFNFGAVAKDPISNKDVNWLIQWTLRPTYSSLPKGLGKIRIALLLVRMSSMTDPGIGEYTIKMYIIDKDEVKYNVFGWDEPAD